MSRFEIDIASVGRVIIDHPAESLDELRSELAANEFILTGEIRGSSSGGTVPMIIASRHVALVRSIDSDSRQGTTFRPKR